MLIESSHSKEIWAIYKMTGTFRQCIKFFMLFHIIPRHLKNVNAMLSNV